MKKVSLLAASVALALVGCGGSDGDSNTNTGTPSAGGIVITGFDGYFKNAVVFLDSATGTLGKLDASDTVLGLTDTKGQITLPKDADLSTGTIALQTLKPGEVVNLDLGDRIAAATDKTDFGSDYSDTYTTDMDLPGQPMEHSVVFRSQQVGDNIVISPITDLVALQPATVYSTEKSAEQKVCDSLFGENEVTDKACTDKLYSDFTQSDPKLHKTAQILTDTKAKNTHYTAETALKATVVAVAAVETLTPDELKDPTVRTDVTIADNGTVEDTPPVFTVSKPLLTVAKFNEVQNAFDGLNIKTTKEVAGSKGTLLGNINIANLFTMHNGESVEINKSEVNVRYALDVDNKNQSFYGRINDKNEFELYQTANQSISSVGKVNVIFTTDNGENNTTANFSFDVQAEAGAVKPTIDTEYLPEAKETLANLGLIVGQPFNTTGNMTLSADAFFNDTVKTIELSSNANAIGLTIKLDEYQKDIIISGSPTHSAKAGEYFIQLRATADNGLHSDVIKLDLPAIVEAIEINDHEVKLLQEKINTLELTVGEKIDLNGLDLDITPIFNSNVGGDIEYYAGLEFDKKSRNNHEYYTTIPGVRVYTDEVNGLGTLTILGTPKEATKGGYFYVASGINPDTENEIISKMVKITLPNVKPTDEVIPPTDTKLEGITWYVAEYGTVDGSDSGTGHDRIWCESIKFSNGKVFTNTRSATNLSSCSEADVEWDGATYTVSNAGKTIDVSLPPEKNGEVSIETMRYKLTQTEDNISKGSATVYTQEINASDEMTYSQRYTFFSNKTDLEARLNIQSNSDGEGRAFPMYLPSASGPKLGTVTLSLEENTHSNDDGSFDADVTFDLPGESITCEMVRGVFNSFTFSNGHDITSTSNNSQTSSFECYNGKDDGSEIQHATVDFDLPNLTVDDVYSILGKTTTIGKEQVELIKFNIEWTGVGNNE